MSRPIRSVVPAAANGTTTFTGLLGQSCAWATALASSAITTSAVAPDLRPIMSASARLCACDWLSFALIFLLHGREKTFAAERVQQAQVDVVLDLLAAAGKLRQEVLGALARDLEIGRRLCLEVGIGDVEDFRIGDPELPGEHRLGAGLVREREIVALDRALEEACEHVAPGVAAPRHDRAEYPGDLLRHEIDEDVDALRAREAGGRLVDRRS